MHPVRLNLRVYLQNEEAIELIFSSLRLDSILCMSARSSGKGTIIRNPPKGWIIRRDPQDDAFEGQPKHYHCEKDGQEIVITHDGFGSHDTISGDRINKKLGDFLDKKLGIPINKDSMGKHVIRLEVTWPWYPYQGVEPENILSELLNHWYVVDSEYQEDKV